MIGSEGVPDVYIRWRLLQEDAFANTSWLEYPFIPEDDRQKMLLMLEVRGQLAQKQKTKGKQRSDGLGSGVMEKSTLTRKNIIVVDDVGNPIEPPPPPTGTPQPLPPVRLKDWGKMTPGAGVMPKRH